MHSSVALTAAGTPLGLAAVKFWTRKAFKGTNALKKKVNPTRIPIEQKQSVRWLENLKRSTELLGDPSRCVHIGDRARHLRAVPRRPGGEDPLPGPRVRGPAGRRGRHDQLAGDGM